MNRIKDFFRKCILFVRAGIAAVVLGLIETFGSPRGRRLLAVGVLLGGVLLLVMRPPVPVPDTRPRSTLCSRASLRTSGEERTSSSLS